MVLEGESRKGEGGREQERRWGGQRWRRGTGMERGRTGKMRGK